MKFYRSLLLILLAALLTFFPSREAWAADVVLGGTVVFRIDSEEQATKISTRIEQTLQNGATENDVRVVRTEIPSKTAPKPQTDKEGKTSKPVAKKTAVYSIYYGNNLVITVTEALAKQNGSTPQALAYLWAENIQAVAAIGLLNVSTNRLVMAIDGNKVVTCTGLANGPLQAYDAANVVKVTVDQENGQLTVEPLRVGKSKIIVTKGKGVQSIFVQVKDWAGKLPKQVVIEVTGSPALETAVSQAVLLSLSANTQVNPGCSVYIDESGFKPVSIPSGDHMRLAVPVGITASDDYFPVRGEVPVLVKNIELDPVEQNLLLVSNRPERVSVDGILLNYTFKKKEPTRLMYSHLNESPGRRNLWINVANLNDTPVKMVINWTCAGPERSEVHVGQTSAKRYLESLGAQSGFIVTLEPHSAMELASHDMRPQALVTGFATFRILEGDSATVEVRTALAPSSNDGRAMPNIGAPFNPFKIHPHGVFAQPYFDDEGEFTVGGAPYNYRYGESPWLIDFETGLPNTGNFGVLYKALVDLKNPTNQTRMVGLYFKPLSGPGGANFLVGNKVYQATFRKMNDEVLVAKIELNPGANEQIEVITFPEATSCYPAQFEIRDIAY